MQNTLPGFAYFSSESSLFWVRVEHRKIKLSSQLKLEIKIYLHSTESATKKIG